MKLRLYRSEWFVNLGLVGFVRIIKEAGRNDEIKMEDNYLEFDSSLLEEFPQYYFDYFQNRYDIYEREKEKVNRYLNVAQNEDRFKDAAKWIKGVVKNNRDKIKGKLEDESYEEELNRIFQELRGFKDPERLEELEELVEDFERVMAEKPVNQKLTLSYFKYLLGSKYFGQSSFLNVYYSRYKREKQQEKMYEDYIKPIFEDVRLDETLKKAENITELQEFIANELERDDLSQEYKKLLKQYIRKKFIKEEKELADVKEYLAEEVFSCSIWEQYRSNSQFTNKNNMSCEFTESRFIPLAVSNKKAKNFMWKGNTAFPISNLVKLILLCTPAGTVDMKNDYAGFVNLDTSIKELCKHNRNLRKHSTGEELPFKEVIYDIVQETKEKSKWLLQNVLFVEFNAEYESKSCKLNYFNIPKPVATYFKEHAEDDLSKIGDVRFKRNVVNLILSNKAIRNEVYNFNKGTKDTVVVNNLTSLVDAKLRDELKESTGFAYDPLMATIARHKLNQIKKGEEKVTSSRIWMIFKKGEELKNYFKNKQSENKIQGLAYRLLNATNARNKKQFMDSLLRIYMGAGKEVPGIFLDILDEEDMDFETVAHAFISGFIPEKNGQAEELEGEEN